MRMILITMTTIMTSTIEWLIWHFPIPSVRHWMWCLLPDNCSIPDRHTYITCDRTGVRGNENWIEIGNNQKWLMCDNCHSKWMHKFKKPD